MEQKNTTYFENLYHDKKILKLIFGENVKYLKYELDTNIFF